MPRLALPHEVTLLIPNIFNVGETVPVNVPRKDLMNIYMTIFQNQLGDLDAIDETEEDYTYGQGAGGTPPILPEW